MDGRTATQSGHRRRTISIAMSAVTPRADSTHMSASFRQSETTPTDHEDVPKNVPHNCGNANRNPHLGVQIS